MKQSLYSITSNVEILPGIYLMWIKAPDIASSAQPGQFITVCCGELILRRPFSIHQVVIASEAKQSQIAILFRVIGKGTLWLSQLQRGDKIDVLGPLGRGFSIKSSSKNLLLVAGGIGISPLIFLVQHAWSQYSVTLIHGASTVTQLYPCSSLQAESLSAAKGQRSNLLPLPDKVRFISVTEDGSMGEKGVVTDVLPHLLDWADQIYACGPVDMYKAMANMSSPASPLSLRAKRSNLKLKKCQVSLEVRMGCGMGACYGCTINTKKGLKQVCQDGPIFELDDIIWEEVRI